MIHTFLIIALPAEAKPIRQILGLIRNNKLREFPVYQTANTHLIISGVGKDKVRQACQYLHQHIVADTITWINLGIAGHATHPIGRSICISLAYDSSNQYITTTSPDCAPLIKGELTTQLTPNTHYLRPTLYDMEGAFFIAKAHQLSPRSSVFCLKVISDNRQNPIHQLNGKKISQLIQSSDAMQLIQQWESRHAN